MKQLSLILISIFFICSFAAAQLTGTRNIPGDYATLAAAITDLNAQGVGAGGVTFNVIAGNPQTAPAGGYVIGGAGSAILSGPNASSSTRPIVFQGNSNVARASAAHTVGSLNDAVFKLVGADWVTIDHFVIAEDAANNTITPEASNNVTEWAIALLRATTTDGAQNNLISANIITLHPLYRNSFGIYSNTSHTAASISTFEDPTATTGANSSNRVYGNTISDVNYPIYFTSSSASAYWDTGNDIGGTNASTGNGITSFGIGLAQSTFWGMSFDNFGISMLGQNNENVGYNTLTSSTILSSSNRVGGILKASVLGSPPGGSVTNYHHNTITATQASSTGSLAGMYISGFGAGTVVTISDNQILNCSITGTLSTGQMDLINVATLCHTVNITGNILRGATGTFNTVAPLASFNGINVSSTASNAINISNNIMGNATTNLFTTTSPMGGVRAILNGGSTATTTVNIENNSIDRITCASATNPNIINNSAPTGVALNIRNNELGTASGNTITFTSASTGTFFGIYNGGNALTCVITIEGNNIEGIVDVVAGAAQRFINNQSGTVSVSINSNTFTNIVSRTGGFIFFILHENGLASGGSFTCNNNSIVGTYNKTLTGGQVSFMQAGGNASTGTTVTETGNNFSNVTLVGSPPLFAFNEQLGTGTVNNAPTKTISNNTFSNINTQAFIACIYTWRGNTVNITSNTITNITGNYVAAIAPESISNYGTYNITSNTISGITAFGSGGAAMAIRGGTGVTSANINGNTITGISATNAAADIASGIYMTGTSTVINDNIIAGIHTAGPAAATGIVVDAGSNVQIRRNKIRAINNSSASVAAAPRVHGILLNGGSLVQVVNNFVSDLNAPLASGNDVVRGISILSKAASTTYELSHNSVYLNASSSGTDFGSSAVFDSTTTLSNSAAMWLYNNLFVNTSTPAGTGLTTAMRRSDATLTNYANFSNSNLFYAGTPGPARLIYTDGTNADQTLAAFKARVNPREVEAISEMPAFVSISDLHLQAGLNCAINAAAGDVGYTTDIDGDTRATSFPDIGADEFDPVYTNSLAGIAGSTTCQSRRIASAGSEFATQSCNRIAKVVPAGGNPIDGSMTACVYIDPAVLPVYNAEPYVQRHIDLIPLLFSPGKTARVTLYFTDAEFVTFNANNSSFPDLPTVATGGNSDTRRANLRVSQYHGNPLTSPSSPNQYSDGTAVLIDPADGDVFYNGNFWEVSFDVTGFSGFYVHTNLRYVLPIEVNYFRGSKQGSNHLLDWKVTCNSTPKATLTLERSSNATGGFTPIYSIEATAARCNQPFSHTDAQPLPGMNYYRVKMVDAEGKVTYSTIVALLNAIKGFDIVSIAPNPVVGGHFKLNVTAAAATIMDIVMIDMQGRVVKRRQLGLNAGFSSIDMHVADLASGTYSLYGVSAGGRTSMVRVVKK